VRRVADVGADRMSYQNQIEQAYRTRQLADAKRAAKLGLNTFEDLKEVRVVGDEERAIVDALNELRHRCTYVFTTGGIGPTHGNITADCVAKVFGVPIDPDPRAGAEMNEARLRMTRIPKGASSTRCHGALASGNCNRDGAGQTRGRGHAGANAASTIKLRLSLALSRRKRGSSLGSTNQINDLYRIGQLLLFPSPIFLQINSGTRGTGLPRVLVPPISYEE